MLAYCSLISGSVFSLPISPYFLSNVCFSDIMQCCDPYSQDQESYSMAQCG